MSSCVIVIVLLTVLQSDLESFILSERIKIQDECSLQAVSKVIGTSCGKKDHVQQMINDWSSAFLRVSVTVK